MLTKNHQGKNLVQYMKTYIQKMFYVLLNSKKNANANSMQKLLILNANLINYFDFLHNTQDCLLVNMESVVGRHHRVVRVAVERIRPPPTILTTRNPLHHRHNITITITNTSTTLLNIIIRILILITILRIIFISIIIRRIICCALNRSHFWTRPALATH